MLMGGIGSGLVYRLASKWLLLCKIDDPLDAFAVHGAGGGWGVLAAAFFSTPHYTEAALGVAAPPGWKDAVGPSTPPEQSGSVPWPRQLGSGRPTR